MNGEMLYYIRDITNNIIGLLDFNNQLVSSYSYDTFGNVLTKEGTYVSKNPILYKGYYYEHTIRLYYLVSRYYDPYIRRFISPDSIDYLEPTSFDGLNLYVYCGNSPIIYSDPSGHFALLTFEILATVGIVSAAVFLGGTSQLISNAMAGKTGSELWRGVAGAAVGSGVNALALCLLPFTGGTSLVFAALLGASTQTSIDTLETIARGEKVDGWQTILDLV